MVAEKSHYQASDPCGQLKLGCAGNSGTQCGCVFSLGIIHPRDKAAGVYTPKLCQPLVENCFQAGSY